MSNQDQLSLAGQYPLPGAAQFSKGPNILQRLNAVQRKVSYIQKEKKAGMNYSIVSHDAVTALVRPHMVEQGILYYPIKMDHRINGNRTEVVLSVRFTSVDDRDDFIELQTAGYGIDPQDKGAGKALSYAIKYALLKVLGLETGDDPDLDQSSVYEPPVSMGAVAQMVIAGADMARDVKELERFYQENSKLFSTLREGDKASYDRVMDHMKAAKKLLQEKASSPPES